ncbi:MAG: SixA phosphatase family protein [Alphaproteobacteria bacterium]
MSEAEPFTGKRLFLLRHAMASSEHSGDDNTRPLAPQGTQDAMALGRYMQHHDFTPDLILCSSARRTRETLDGLSKTLSLETVNFIDILYSGSTGDYLYEIQKADNKHNNILMIAHNPCIYELIRLLAAQGEEHTQQRLMEGYAPATLSVIHCRSSNWSTIQPVENALAHIASPIDYNAPARPTRWM